MNIHLEQEERHRLTLEAITDVDNGNVIGHHSVQAWAESLATDTPLTLMSLIDFRE